MLNRQGLARVWTVGGRTRLPFGNVKEQRSLGSLTVLAIVSVLLLSACSGSSGGTKGGFSVPNPYAQGGGVNDVRANTLRVFGDSYSVPSFSGTPTWPTFLGGSGAVSSIQNYAVGGARAAPTGAQPSFDRQVGTWLRRNSPIGDGDLTVAYFGYNDIGRRGNPDGFASARAGYQATVAALVANGAAEQNRRLFLTQIHDWSRNPGVPAGLRDQVFIWNDFIASQANTYENVVAVDLFTVFERVYAKPDQFGFTNVTTVNAGRSAIDALYLDDLHFGPKGQEVIARTYRHYLTRGWDWSNRTRAGSDAARRLGQDLDKGLLSFHFAAPDSQSSGLNVHRLGGQPADMYKRRLDDRREDRREVVNSIAADSDGFMLGFTPSVAGRGVGPRFGLSVARYGGSVEARNFEGGDYTDYVSDALGLYWQQTVRGLLASTQVSFLKHEFDSRGSDDLLGMVAVNQGRGDTWSLAQRLSRPVNLGPTSFVPWVSVALESNKLSPGTVSSLYTSDVHFSGIRTNDWIGQVGIDLQLDPIRFGSGKTLILSSSAGYLTSLYRDDIEVSMAEAAMPGVIQRERLQRDRSYQVGLGLAASLDLGNSFLLATSLSTSSFSDGRSGNEVNVVASYQF
jgi:lysophospholipase L1-like esterase